MARRAGIPLIREVNAPYVRERSRHGGLALPRLAAWAEVKAWRSADAVVAVTGVLADIIAEAGVKRDRLHVMPNGVDSRTFSRAAIDPDAKSKLGLTGFTVLGFTGYVRDWNGLDVAINLLARPDGQQLFVLVVGDGPRGCRWRPGLRVLVFQHACDSPVSSSGTKFHRWSLRLILPFNLPLIPMPLH